MMPVLNGFQVLREIRADPTRKNLPVIMLTGESDPDSEQAALRLGANYYVSKPWKREALKAAVRVTLREAGVILPAKPDSSVLPDSDTPSFPS